MIGTSLKSPMSGTLTSIFATGASPSRVPGQLLGKTRSLSAPRRARPFRIDLVARDRLGNALGGQQLIVGERLQARDRNVIAIDFEERAQPAAVIRAAESVRAEHLDSGRERKVRTPSGIDFT